MGTQSVINGILGKVAEMPLEDQGLLIDLITNRYKEQRREDILVNACQIFEEHKKGLTSQGTLSDLFRELEA